MFDDHIMYRPPYPNLSLYYVGCVPYMLYVDSATHVLILHIYRLTYL